jgi:hypothetical protein
MLFSAAGFRLLYKCHYSIKLSQEVHMNPEVKGRHVINDKHQINNMRDYIKRNEGHKESIIETYWNIAYREKGFKYFEL